MRIFALEIVIENSSKKWVFIAHKQICPLAAAKVRNDPPIDRPVDRPTVIFMTIVPLVDRPVDRDWNREQRLCRTTGTGYREQQLSTDRPAGWPGPFPESRALWTVDHPVERPTSPSWRARLCTSVDRTGRPTGRRPVKLLRDLKTWLFTIK